MLEPVICQTLDSMSVLGARGVERRGTPCQSSVHLLKTDISEQSDTFYPPYLFQDLDKHPCLAPEERGHLRMVVQGRGS